eukprot:g18869.t1
MEQAFNQGPPLSSEEKKRDEFRMAKSFQYDMKAGVFVKSTMGFPTLHEIPFTTSFQVGVKVFQFEAKGLSMYLHLRPTSPFEPTEEAIRARMRSLAIIDYPCMHRGKIIALHTPYAKYLHDGAQVENNPFEHEKRVWNLLQEGAKSKFDSSAIAVDETSAGRMWRGKAGDLSENELCQQPLVEVKMVQSLYVDSHGRAHATYQAGSELRLWHLILCLSELSRARCFQLDCGHKYHSLCLASSFQIQQLCPLCRAGVSDATCTEVARSLFVGAGPHGARFAAELLTELGARQRTVELRLVAVQALRNLVPAFPGGWPGWQAVRGLLQKVALEDVAVEELRLCSIQALKEVSRRDAHDEALSVAFNILQETLRPDGNCVSLLAASYRQFCCVLHRPSRRLLHLYQVPGSLRTHAVQAIRTCAGPRGTSPWLIAELARLAARSEWPEARLEAMNLLGQLERFGGEGMQAAAAALDDKDEQVACAAVRAIGGLWPPEPGQSCDQALYALISLLQQAKSSELRCFASRRVESILQNLRRGISKAARAAGARLADEDISVSNAAAQALRKMSLRGDRELQEMLLEYLAHSDLEVCKVAVELLGFVSERGDEGERALIALREGPDEDMSSLCECVERILTVLRT